MRTTYLASAAVLLGLATATVVFGDDLRWVEPTVLFWLVTIAASLCALTSMGLAKLAHRLDQVELAIVAAFFFVASMLPLVHGLTVPGVLYGDNAVTTTSVGLTIPVGALVAAYVANGPGRWRVRLASSAALVVALCLVLLAAPQTRLFPEPGSAIGIAYALSSFALMVGFGWRHVGLAVIAGRPQPLVVAVGYLLLGASVLVFLGATTWSSYFWIAHLVDITGVFLATVGALVVYRRHGSISAVLDPVTALAPRRAFEIGLSPVVHRFVADLDEKDPMTRDHVVRTGALAVDVAIELGLDPDEIRRCGLVGLLHDVGKLEIPDRILGKPGRLTDDEFAVMRTHTVVGGRLAASSEVLADLGPAIRGHHERIDGRGYPDGLEDQEIPLAARVVAVCDSYDAMAFTRHYRVGMDAAKVRSILREHAGAQWDPLIVAALLRVVDRRSDEATWALDRVGRDRAPGPEPVRIGCDCLPELAEV